VATESEWMERKRELYATARKKWPSDQGRQSAYVYGTLRKMGWKPKSKKT